MSKARLVITAVIVEGRSQAEVARTYEVSPGWVSKLVARYRSEGDAAFEPRSRRPKTSPKAVKPSVVDAIVELRTKLSGAGLDAGPDTIRWHLEHHHGVRVSSATISRYLAKAGLVTPQPQKKPRSSYIRFEADQPNECWQSDFTHYRLVTASGAPGAHVEILSWLDDHSRKALSVTAHRRITGRTVLGCFREAVAIHGVPASTLTDNGMVFTTRLAGGKGGRNASRIRASPPGRAPEELPAEPSDHLRQGRTIPADHEEVVAGSTPPTLVHRRNSRPSSTSSSTTTTNAGPTAHSPSRRHRQPPTWPVRRPAQGPAHPIPMIAYVGTESTRPGRSPCAYTASSTTSASGESTPEPTSSCSSTSSTYGSSRPPPASYSGTSRWTRPGTISPRAPRRGLLGPGNRDSRGFGSFLCPARSQRAHGRI